jgi:hypothetical protein
MKTIVYIIKGILMYSTLIYWILIIALVDNFDVTQTLIVFGVGFAMIFICKYTLTLEDVAILTGNDSKELQDETI